MKKIFIFLLGLLVVSGAIAQHQEVIEKPGIWKGRKEEFGDTSSLLHAFKNGTVNGHFRYFFMATDNSHKMRDYIANAAGGGIRFETAKFHGFQFAVSGFYIFNIGSPGLGKTDSLTGQPNRYEVALFDVEDPENKSDIDRLEELYIRYNWKQSHIIFGKHLINTPFINLQDGRMRPTGVEGIYLELNEGKRFKVEAAWLYAISPRGTTEWYDVGESIGVYPVGVNESGLKSDYKDNLESKGIFMIGGQFAASKRTKLHFWNLYTENIFNSALLQTEHTIPLNDKNSFTASAQVIRQDAVNHGGHRDPEKTYMPKGSQSLSFGARAAYKTGKWDASLNYTRITKDGRYLMPREWGRDPFFTFMPRERNEGLGDLHAITLNGIYKWKKSGLKTGLTAGYFDLPDVSNYRLNKYGMPSYVQVNLDVRYPFKGFLKGMEAQLLVASKFRTTSGLPALKYVFNKVDVINYNFVLNYHF